jgi:uncharacterized membrane protein YsdA (DUF1294 family)
MPRYRPKRFFAAVGLFLAVALSVLLWRLGLPAVYAYLAGVNLVTLLAYWYDKRQAIAGKGRVPEVVLHLAALLGGTPGALLAQGLFRHKTRKAGFRIATAAIIVLQIGLGYLYWRFIHAPC